MGVSSVSEDEIPTKDKVVALIGVKHGLELVTGTITISLKRVVKTETQNSD